MVEGRGVFLAPPPFQQGGSQYDFWELAIVVSGGQDSGLGGPRAGGWERSVLFLIRGEVTIM